MTTVSGYYKTTAERLGRLFGSAEEGLAAARIIFEDVVGYDRNKLFINGERELDEYMQGKIDAVVEKIVAGEPVQYAVGKARFMGMDFAVNPSVLIPRPETEGLVDEVIKLAAGRSDLRVLDIGTGSGCIAVALARALPFSRVEAIDISEAALETAETNAKALKVRVLFRKEDALTLEKAVERYDFIVSNPPYVLESEREDMDKRVYGYEPETALFVPDAEPLRYYEPIIRYASDALKRGGWLCLEINQRFGTEIVAAMERYGLANATWRRDYRGNVRYAYAQKPER